MALNSSDIRDEICLFVSRKNCVMHHSATLPLPKTTTPSMEVIQIPGKGRGVIAKSLILPRQLICRCPVVVIPEEDLRSFEETALADYAFAWPSSRDDRHGNKDLWGLSAIALGLLSMMNHSGRPNAKLVIEVECLEIAVYALRRILEREEITINYEWPEEHTKSFVENGSLS